MQKEQEYQQLEQELQPYMQMMANASDTVIDEEVSSYPIFVVHQDELELGIPLKESTEFDGDWAIHASTLEEFVARQLIQNEKVADFKTIYKTPSNHLCLFVIRKSGATFVFLPRS